MKTSKARSVRPIVTTPPIRVNYCQARAWWNLPRPSESEQAMVSKEEHQKQGASVWEKECVASSKIVKKDVVSTMNFKQAVLSASDGKPNVCPVLGRFAFTLSELPVFASFSDRLEPLVTRVIGTRSESEIPNRLSAMREWSVKVICPMIFDALAYRLPTQQRNISAMADAFRHLPIVTASNAAESKTVLRCVWNSLWLDDASAPGFARIHNRLVASVGRTTLESLSMHEIARVCAEYNDAMSADSESAEQSRVAWFAINYALAFIWEDETEWLDSFPFVMGQFFRGVSHAAESDELLKQCLFDEMIRFIDMVTMR